MVRKYLRSLRREIVGRFNFGVGLLISSLIAACSLILQWKFSLIKLVIASDRWRWIVAVVGPYIVVFVLYFVWRIVSAPYRVYCQQEALIANAEKSISQVLTEKSALQNQLGDSNVSCEVQAIYVSEYREYLGMGPHRQPNYKAVPGYWHIIVDALFFNSGGIATNIWNFKLFLEIPNTGAKFAATFLKKQKERWYLTRHAGLMAGEAFPEDEYSRLSVDWEIDNDDLLKRGNPKQCWVHFLAENFPANLGNFDCVMEFQDGLHDYKHAFKHKLIKTTIERSVDQA